MDLKALLHLTVADCERTVLPVVAVGDEIGAEWIAFNVLQNFEVVLGCLDGKALEPALIKVADTCCSVCGVPSLGVGHCYPLHKYREIAIIARPKQHVPMVAHNAVTAKTHLYASKALSKNTFESEEI